MKHLPF